MKHTQNLRIIVKAFGLNPSALSDEFTSWAIHKLTDRSEANASLAVANALMFSDGTFYDTRKDRWFAICK